jgi:hypothetical protein
MLTFKCPKCDQRIPAEDGRLLDHGHLYTGPCPGSGEPAARPVLFSDNVAKVAARLLLLGTDTPYGTVVVGDKFSAVPYTPDVPDGFPYAVLDLGGAPVILAHDAYDTAVWFCKLESGAIDAPEGAPICLVSNEVACEFARRDSEIESVEGEDYGYYAAVVDHNRAAANQGTRT